MSAQACDVLVLAPHPDDAEIHCGGSIARHVRLGARVVVVDATRGELGSRGTVDQRRAEAAQASEVLGLHARENLGLGDGALSPGSIEQRNAIVGCLRRWRPQVVLGISEAARHPDHLALAALTRAAIKAAALHKLHTPDGAPAIDGLRLFSYEAELPILPAFLVPLTEADWQRKMRAIACYGSQLHRGDGETGQPATSISQPAFIQWIEARGKTWGYQAGAAYAEAFAAVEAVRVGDLRGV